MLFRTLATTAIAGAFVLGAPVALRTATPAQAAAPLALATFEIDAAHSNIMFKVKHLGISTVTGRFGTFSGSFQVDPTSGQTGAANLSIDVASVNTGNERRDGHLKSPDFFAADSFPKITFTSTSITKGRNGMFKVAGNLTMRGVTKPVVLDAELGGPRAAGSNYLAAVNMTGTIKRKDFGLMWDRVTEGVAVVSDEVQIIIEVEAKAAK